MDYPTYLIHYGTPGQKWGVRNYQNSDGTWTEEGKERRRVGNNEIANNQPPNTTLLVNYSGPAIFISSNSDLKSLKPRVPKNYFTENGYEDSETERISFAPSIDKCLAGLSQNVDGKTYTVYSPDDVKKYSVYKPNKKAVPDSVITDEMWICEPVKLKKIGKITVTGNKNKPGKKFSYGDKQAELYDDWTYAYLKHSDYLIHYGIQGQKWGVRRYQNEDGTYTELGKEIRNKQNNYIKVANSLSNKEFDLFSDKKGAHKKREEDNRQMKQYFRNQPNYRDSQVVVSKHGNVTLASKEFNEYVNEWNIGWATDPKARGTGVTQKNIKETIQLIREVSKLPISATIAKENIASQKTAEKAGFKDAGYTRMSDGRVMKRYIYK